MSLPQAAFLLDLSREAGYGGAARGGKSDALMAAALQFVDVPGYAALILRRTFPELRGSDGLLARSHQWLRPHAPLVNWNEQTHTWTFPSGAILEFGHVETEQDRFKYDGRAYQFVGFDELTSFTEIQYEHIGFTRTSPQVAIPVPLRTRGSCTPTGTNVGWVRRRFIKNRLPDVTFVPARVSDNPGVDAVEYEKSLAKVDESLRRRLLLGDWESFEGAAFTLTTDHLVDRFELRDSHNRFEAADYGFNGAPWALWATDYEGNLIACDMIYMRDALASDVANAVIEKRKGGWGIGNTAVMDPSVWHRTSARNKWGAPAMLADEFSDYGVPIEPGNNDPRAGLARVRELLRLDPEHPFPPWHQKGGQLGAPRIFFVRRECAALIQELQDAPLAPVGKADAGEKVDPDWEGPHGHSVAMCRYACLSRPAPSKEPPARDQHLIPPDSPQELRRERLRQEIERRESPEKSFDRSQFVY